MGATDWRKAPRRNAGDAGPQGMYRMFGTNRKSPRLAQWDGRTRSSRSDAIDWRCLRCRGVITRLIMVAAACAMLAWLVIGDGPPFPYRPGQTVPRDVRARVEFEILDEAASARARTAAEAQAPLPTAEAVANAVPPVVEQFSAGLVILKRDDPITAEKLVVLRAEHQAYIESLPPSLRWARPVALSAFIALLGATAVVYSARFQPTLATNTPAVAGVCVWLVLTLGMAIWVNQAPWNAAAGPLVLTAMVLTIAYNPPFALFVSLCLVILLAISQGNDLAPLIVHLGGVATAVLAIREIRTRTRPAEVGLVAGIALAITTAAADSLSGQTVWFTFVDVTRNLIWALLAGFVLTGCLPLIERCFGVITDVSLLELADNSHPLLQELLRRAPGTYTHSMTVAVLAEAAADAVGANPLLTRVGCYYHDIGKMLKPHYFIENQSGANAHDHLEPTLSTLIIVGHVKDGLALAEQYRLPRPIIDFICQHHGTTLVEYFYREALRLHTGANGATADTLEPTFRYPGPKPQSKESCILMLSDAAESAARSLPNPTPGALRKLVHELTMKRLLDGQFDESSLTLSELKAVEEAISKGLVAVYHARIRYSEDPPTAKTA